MSIKNGDTRWQTRCLYIRIIKNGLCTFHPMIFDNCLSSIYGKCWGNSIYYCIYAVISSLSSFSKLTNNHFFLKTWWRGIFCFSWRTFVVKVLFSSNVEIRYKNSSPFMFVFLIIVVLDIQWSGLLKTISFLIFWRRRSFFYEEKKSLLIIEIYIAIVLDILLLTQIVKSIIRYYDY